MMMRYFVLSCTVLIVSFTFGQKNSVDLDPQTKIELATHFLTAQEKEGAKVIAYLEDGSTEVLKASEGHLTCVYDDPKKEGIQFVCYHSQLEDFMRSEEHTSELQSRPHLVCRLLLEKKKK